MTERNPDTLPTSDDPSGPCPNCTRTSSFTMFGSVIKLAGHHRAVALTCQGCNERILVIEQDQRQKLPNGPTILSSRQAVFWWPVPAAGKLDAAIPGSVTDAYKEAVQCLAVGAIRAAVIMFRAMLEAVVNDLETAQSLTLRGRMLGERLQDLIGQQGLPNALVEWVQQIKLLGNFAAHEAAPSPAEAEDLQRLCRQLLMVLYEVPAQLRAARTGASSLVPAPRSFGPISSGGDFSGGTGEQR